MHRGPGPVLDFDGRGGENIWTRVCTHGIRCMCVNITVFIGERYIYYDFGLILCNSYHLDCQCQWCNGNSNSSMVWLW